MYNVIWWSWLILGIVIGASIGGVICFCVGACLAKANQECPACQARAFEKLIAELEKKDDNNDLLP